MSAETSTGVYITIGHPDQLDRAQWRDLQAIARDGFGQSMPKRSPDEKDELVGWNDPERYYDSHVYPNSEVGRRFREGQSFANPLVTIARDMEDGRFLGFAYGADNVSGSERAQELKRLSIIKNYFWLREVVVAPEAQHQDLAHRLARPLLEQLHPWRPVTLYTHPKEEQVTTSRIYLHKLSFHETGEREVEVFGPGNPTTTLVRHEARTAHRVLRRMARY